MSTVTSTTARELGATRASRSWSDGVILVLALLVLWQLCSWLAGPEILPTPWRTAVKALKIVRDEDFPQSLEATGIAFIAALVISAIGGVSLGLVLGARRLAGDVMEPLLMAFYALPKITLYPVVLLMFGLGLSAKVTFGVIHGIIPITVFTMGAVRNMPMVYARTALAYRLTPLDFARYVMLPAAIPEVVAGLRIGFSLTLLGTLIGEMFASQSGIGHMLMIAMARNDTETIMALALMLFLFATGVNLLLLRWHHRLAKTG
jgi:NitT/TauT family transport system permease protein